MKKFRHLDTGLYVEEIYVTWENAENIGKTNRPLLKITKLILSDDYEKARRIKNNVLSQWMLSNGFSSVEVLIDRIPNEIKEIGEADDINGS